MTAKSLFSFFFSTFNFSSKLFLRKKNVGLNSEFKIKKVHHSGCTTDTMTPVAGEMTQQKQRINSEIKTTKFHTLAHYQWPMGVECFHPAFAANKKCCKGSREDAARVAASPTWRHFTTDFSTGLFYHSLTPQETERDSDLHPHGGHLESNWWRCSAYGHVAASPYGFLLRYILFIDSLPRYTAAVAMLITLIYRLDAYYAK